MNTLVGITPSQDLFSITWNLGPRCNYVCSYCPPRLHNKISAHKSLDELQHKWQMIVDKTSSRNKKYKISFTGGEVTINPSFLPFLKWLQSEYAEIISNIGFTTNGSASQKYYDEALDYVNWISFSSHFEFANKDKFKRNILAIHKKSLKSNKTIFVNIMDEHFANAEVDDLIDFCISHRIPHSKMIIHWNDHAEERKKSQL